MKILLIANGPAALSKNIGTQIDAFDGQVVRFNSYVTSGFKQQVGSRTDIWFTVAVFSPPLNDEHKKRLFFSWATDEKTQKEIDYIKAYRIPLAVGKKTVDDMGFDHPSTGAIATTYFLAQGHEVWIWGFDFLSTQRRHHYSSDAQKRGVWHDGLAEWRFFNELIRQGKIHTFGRDPAKESIPIFRQPVPCGTDDDLTWYRQAAHAGWYHFIGDLCRGKTVIDVGAGMCEGMKILRQYATRVIGVENDPRLAHLDKDLMISDSLDIFGDNSFDAVSCVDVIEHVVEDIPLMNHMKRIARELIVVTTPNYTRSQCGNIAHCREYTISQFMNAFQPTQIWSASPDGKVHHTLVLERCGRFIIDHSKEGPENKKPCSVYLAYRDEVPHYVRFNNTVDGLEWAHICGVFEL